MSTSGIKQDHWYDAREAAGFLHVTPETVKKYCREKVLRAERRGPKQEWFVLGAAILRLLKKWRTSP